MCFIIDKKHKKEKIASKNIICYKILEMKNIKIKGIFSSPYQKFIYNFKEKTHYIANTNKLLKIDNQDYNNNIIIYNGLHSYSTIKNAELHKNNLSLIYDDKVEIFECIIPKGTKYYYNSERKEYVSLELKFKKRLTFDYKRD